MSFNPFKLITQEDYQRIHDASLQILRETGVVFHSQEALEIFKKHGARVNGEIVYLDAPMIEHALESCPEKFVWQARNPDHSVTVGEGILIQPNVGPVYIEDLDRGRRLATLKDYANIMKLCQASDVIDLNGSIPVDPSDVEADKKYFYIMYEMLKNTDKPIIGACVSRPEAKKMLEMAELALGQEGFLEQNPCVGVLVNSLSPLAYAPETLETIIEYSRKKQIILLAPCIMAGVSGPISLLGTAVLQNVELLAGITLTQLVNPGTPVVYATASTVGYMKTASYAAGSPEAMLINTPNIQMGLDFYHLPTRTMCGINHAKVLDCQAGYETMMSLMMGLMSGAHIFVQCLGVLDAIMTTSYEKIIIDEELIRRVKRIRQGVDTSDKALAVDVIQEVGYNGTYLTHESTFESFRNIWLPTVSNWESYQDWRAEGGEDVTVRAHRRYKEILAKAPESLLDPEVEKALRRYLV
ncbi:trimethylamine methyltransferase family protein [Candidatus Formimonas warabiya]|uniref:trimethylamine methyltransferase family protein n=1 Tax=Formimonas warabiya TaxID=1761012 RepID=UPI0011D04318|nr:trimethylamine methyltransferase family protein [Candidatus Formimonas warabiya]